jgi:bleomycin hydrolase
MTIRFYFKVLVFLLFAGFIFSSVTFAVEGAITIDMIDHIRTNFAMDTHTRAMYNAITNNDINTLALNRDLLRQHNDIFSHRIKTKGITNQKSSGRCWLFAGLNVLRPAVMQKYKLDKFEFSENYLAFWDKMEKANSFLEHMIEFRDRDPVDDRALEILVSDPIGDGGWWSYVVNLIDKYGVVPQEIMPETNSSEKTSGMNRLISQQLRADAVKLRKLGQEGKSVKQLRTEKTDMMAVIFRMLVMNLGEPPTEFSYRYQTSDSVVSELKTYTPQSFYQDFVGVDLHEYVSLFDDPSKVYGKHYQIRLSKNMYDKNDVDYANVEVATMKDIALKSVLDDEPVWFACDVGRDQDGKNGIMAMNIYDYNSIYNTDMTMSKADQALFRESSPNHAMVFVGVDVKDEKPVKWLVENSWGKDRGDEGYWTMYDTWFDNHVYNIIVKKKYVPEDILKIYEQPAIVLPPWDPMFSMFR